MFFVTSGIYAVSGKFTTEERLLQTLQTAHSIRDKIPNVTILLLDGSKESLTKDQTNVLNTIYDGVIDFSSHSIIKYLHDQNINSAMIKGPCESLMLKIATEKTKETDDTYDLFFKISGRYCLSDEFSLDKHICDQYVFKRKEHGIEYYRTNPEELHYPDNISKYHTEYQYKTRLYSFPRNLLDTAIKDYNNIFNRMVLCYDDYGFTDIEHSTYYSLDHNNVKEVDVIGLEGPQAENGISVKE